MKKFLLFLLYFLLSVVAIIAIALRINYGGGKEYLDLSTTPLYDPSPLELVYSHNEPIGNVAVSKNVIGKKRLFFTIHPESRPMQNKLMEIVDGNAVPYPSANQQQLFNTVLGVFTDQQNRLWTLDHGSHGFEEVKLIAFDLQTNNLVDEYVFPPDVANRLSFYNDLTVSPDGNFIAISNVSFFGKSPSLVVYNIATQKSKELLVGHPSVNHENYVPVPPAKMMRFLGLVDLLVGIDGIDFSRDGMYIYYAGMSNSGLYRIPTAVAFNFDNGKEVVASSVQWIINKPLSDGIRTDFSGNIYITDIENQGVYVVNPKGQGYTLFRDERIRWADGLSLASDGTFYLADSDIPNQMLKSKSHMAANAPYNIYSFKAVKGNAHRKQ